jgi:hypothetical protein
MHRTLALVKPVLRSLRLNVSTAFATMQVSNWRRASNSCSVTKGLTAMRFSFQQGFPVKCGSGKY